MLLIHLANPQQAVFSASFTDKEVGGYESVMRLLQAALEITVEEDQEEEAAESCKQWLLLRGLAWMLQQLYQSWMTFSQ